MFQSIGYIYNNTLTIFTLDCLHTKQITSWHEERRMFKKESAICPTLIWIYTGKSHSLRWIKSLQPLCPWRKPVSQKIWQQTLQLWRLMVYFGFHTSLQCFWVFYQPHILACELVHESVFQIIHKLPEQLTWISSFISSPFKDFVFKVLGLRLIKWTHLKLLQD